MNRRRLLTAAFAGALFAGAMATPAFAAEHAGTKTAKDHKVVAKAQQRRKTPFTVVGTVSAVDPTAGTVSVAVRSGMRDLRGRTVTVTVTGSTRVRYNDAAASLSTLPVGARVTVVGTRGDSGLTAAKVVASTKTADGTNHK
jgi:uncharacterized membrane protein